MLFLEHDVYHPAGDRLERWYDAEGGRSCGVPWVIIDSGFRVTCGRQNFAIVYRHLVDEALANPPTADVRATYELSDSNVVITAEVTNWSGLALGATNHGTVNALVFERLKVVHTERFMRAGTQKDIVPDLPHGQTGTYVLTLRDVPVADWARSTVIVLVDYRPTADVTRYEALQAAIARPVLDAARLSLPVALSTRAR